MLAVPALGRLLLQHEFTHHGVPTHPSGCHFFSAIPPTGASSLLPLSLFGTPVGSVWKGSRAQLLRLQFFILQKLIAVSL